MSDLYVCYSPKGVKFELSRPNYLDAIGNFKFTNNPPKDTADADEQPAGLENEVEDEDADEGTVEDEGTGDEAEDAEEEDEVADEPPAPAYIASNKDSVKAFLRAKGVEFDGRAGLDDLLKLAEKAEAEA